MANNSENTPYFNNVGQINSEINGLVVVTSEDGYYGVPSDNINVTVDPTQKSIKAELVQTQFPSKNDFPEIGSEKLIYLDLSDNSLWRYDSTLEDYVGVGRYIQPSASKEQKGGIWCWEDEKGIHLWTIDPMEVHYTVENGVYNIKTMNYEEQNGVYTIGGNE